MPTQNNSCKILSTYPLSLFPFDSQWFPVISHRWFGLRFSNSIYIEGCRPKLGSMGQLPCDGMHDDGTR